MIRTYRKMTLSLLLAAAALACLASGAHETGRSKSLFRPGSSGGFRELFKTLLAWGFITTSAGDYPDLNFRLRRWVSNRPWPLQIDKECDDPVQHCEVFADELNYQFVQKPPIVCERDQTRFTHKESLYGNHPRVDATVCIDNDLLAASKHESKKAFLTVDDLNTFRRFIRRSGPLKSSWIDTNVYEKVVDAVTKFACKEMTLNNARTKKYTKDTVTSGHLGGVECHYDTGELHYGRDIVKMAILIDPAAAGGQLHVGCKPNEHQDNLTGLTPLTEAGDMVIWTGPSVPHGVSSIISGQRLVALLTFRPCESDDGYYCHAPQSDGINAADFPYELPDHEEQPMPDATDDDGN